MPHKVRVVFCHVEHVVAAAQCARNVPAKGERAAGGPAGIRMQLPEGCLGRPRCETEQAASGRAAFETATDAFT